ncbi:glycosyltransferase family 2 protein [Mesonia sp.]|uniref:glycosyltransferase family 2 protein n=1 Tax=Mesonia sp. TaxID=1960830 RepID=UPI001766CE3D|nr:glycosyltransferase family 2 protein [Mesonia sp.]HIB37501.1 glycosyltransferase [Mesonia sp.]HIO27832.1 glycosyltransferase [Flavobacteriaceae bacterium]
MKNLPLISVIIPVYNAQNFIHNAFQFIKDQNVDLTLEIIFVDNNSTDNSFEMLSELSSSHENVFIYQQTIQGAAATRNKGLQEAKGEFIYFFDVDDQLFRDSLKALSQALIENPSVEAVFGKMLKSNKSVNQINSLDLDETNQLILKEKPYWGMKWFKDLSSVVGPPAFMYRKTVFDKIGNYEENLYTGEDTALDIKLGFLANIAKIDKYIYLYLKHDSSTTDILKKKKSREFMQWPRITKSHLPFYLSGNANSEFGKILYRKIFSSMGKMICEKKTFQQRKNVLNQLCQDIRPLKTPSLLKSALKILVVLPQGYLLKFYLYYLVPAESKKI